MTNGTSLEAKPLRFAYSRLSSLLRTLQVENLDDFNALTDIADFASLLATYSEGVAKFAVIMDPNNSAIPGATDPVIQLSCLDASLAIAPVFKRFGSVIITSGTLSPMNLYPKLLQFEPCVSECLNMSTFRQCIKPLVITRGSDQLTMSTRYEDRGYATCHIRCGRILTAVPFPTDPFRSFVTTACCWSNSVKQFPMELWRFSHPTRTWNH